MKCTFRFGSVSNETAMFSNLQTYRIRLDVKVRVFDKTGKLCLVFPF